MKEALHLAMVLLLALQGALGDVAIDCNELSATGHDQTPATGYTLDATPDADQLTYTVTIKGDSSNKFVEAYAGAYIQNKLIEGTVMATQGAAKDCSTKKQYFELKGTNEMESVEFKWKYMGSETGKTPEFRAIVCKPKGSDPNMKCTTPPMSKVGVALPATTAAAGSTAAPGTATDAKKSGAGSLSTVVVPALVTVAAFVCLRKFPFLLHAVMVVH